MTQNVYPGFYTKWFDWKIRNIELEFVKNFSRLKKKLFCETLQHKKYRLSNRTPLTIFLLFISSLELNKYLTIQWKNKNLSKNLMECIFNPKNFLDLNHELFFMRWRGKYFYKHLQNSQFVQEYSYGIIAAFKILHRNASKLLC